MDPCHHYRNPGEENFSPEEIILFIGGETFLRVENYFLEEHRKYFIRGGAFLGWEKVYFTRGEIYFSGEKKGFPLAQEKHIGQTKICFPALEKRFSTRYKKSP